jgi:hypothetical protein
VPGKGNLPLRQNSSVNIYQSVQQGVLYSPMVALNNINQFQYQPLTILLKEAMLEIPRSII